MDIGSLDMGDFVAIGAIFAATDSGCTLQVLNQDETPLLYSLVFGEGVVNDVTSVVLFNAIQSFDLTNSSPGIALEFIGKVLYLFLASTLLGAAVGLVSAYIIKTLYFGRPGTSIIVSSVPLLLVMAGRAAFVFPIIIWWSGLMRGAVSMALAYNQMPEFHILSSFSKFRFSVYYGDLVFGDVSNSLSVGPVDQVFGLMTKPLIRFLISHSKVTIRMLSESSPKSAMTPFLERARNSSDDGPKGAQRSSSIRALLTTPTHTVHYYWRKFDNGFMQPVFGGRGFVPGSPTERSEHNLSQLQ
ncbi:hypothetical protein V6N13_140684 [Hibiscus sabdariffa]